MRGNTAKTTKKRSPEMAQAQKTNPPAQQAETKAPAPTDADIFDTPAGELTSSGGGSSEAYKASEGIHQATIVAAVDMGMQENTFKPGTKQRKGQLLFALNDQNVMFTGDNGEEQDTGEPITVISKQYTISFHEKSSLLKDYKTMGFKFDEKTSNFGGMVGGKCQLVIGRSEEGHVTVQVAPPAKGQVDPDSPVYVPRFWLFDKDQQPTGYRMKLHPTLVTPGERPKRETT